MRAGDGGMESAHTIVVQQAHAVPRPGLFYWASALLIMNLLDGIFTVAAVQAGAATEANPLMQLPLALGSVWFILAKTGLVSVGVLLPWPWYTPRWSATT